MLLYTTRPYEHPLPRLPKQAQPARRPVGQENLPDKATSCIWTRQPAAWLPCPLSALLFRASAANLHGQQHRCMAHFPPPFSYPTACPAPPACFPHSHVPLTCPSFLLPHLAPSLLLSLLPPSLPNQYTLAEKSNVAQSASPPATSQYTPRCRCRTPLRRTHRSRLTRRSRRTPHSPRSRPHSSPPRRLGHPHPPARRQARRQRLQTTATQ